jgi:hypothetical protein
MKSTPIASSLRRAALLPLIFAGVLLHAADATGSWTWSTPGRNGGAARTNTLTLKVEGSKLTGKVAAPNHDGASVETPVTDGKIEGDSLSFSVVREFNGTTTTAKYAGKVAADKITGKVETTRDGQPQSRDWEAKRSTEIK